MRYAIIAERDGGPINPGYLWLATGELLVCDGLFQSLTVNASHGAIVPPFRDTMLIQFSLATGNWFANFASIIQPIGLIGIGAFIDKVPVDGNVAPWNMPVTSANGLPPHPTRVVVTPLRWWETSPYPFLG